MAKASASEAAAGKLKAAARKRNLGKGPILYDQFNRTRRLKSYRRYCVRMLFLRRSTDHLTQFIEPVGLSDEPPGRLRPADIHSVCAREYHPDIGTDASDGFVNLRTAHHR